MYLDPFESAARTLDLRDQDRNELELLICQNSSAGDLIVGTGGCRKLRFSPSRWAIGTLGGLRVYYAVFEATGIVAVIYAHRKNHQESITHGEKRAIKSLIDQIQSYLSR